MSIIIIITVGCGAAEPLFHVRSLRTATISPSSYKHAGFHGNLEQDLQSKHSSSQEKSAKQWGLSWGGGLGEEEEEEEDGVSGEQSR